MPPNIALPNNNLPNLGDPRTNITGPLSNGTGSGAGLGSGDGGGIGSGDAVAQQELEEKLLEGLQGPAFEMTREDWESIRREAIEGLAGETIRP